MLEWKVDAAHELRLLNGGGLAELVISRCTEKWGWGGRQYCEVALTVIEALSLVRGNEVIKPPSNSSSSRPPAARVSNTLSMGILLLHWSWLQRQWLAQCQWLFKTYFTLSHFALAGLKLESSFSTKYWEMQLYPCNSYLKWPPSSAS